MRRFRCSLRRARSGHRYSRLPSEAPAKCSAYAANSYFDALEGDDGKIAAFADDCVRHENGYQTVNNPPPGGRMMPAPPLPNPDTPQGKEQLRFSMLTCSAQIDSKIFAYMKHIRRATR